MTNANHDQIVIDAFLDALWSERGLGKNTLAAYGRDLKSLAAWLQKQGKTLLQCSHGNLQDFLASKNQTR